MAVSLPKVLFVSKAIAPPWNDSSKNLAWWVARKLARHRVALLSYRGSSLEPSLDHIEWVGAYRASARAGGFQVQTFEKLRVFQALSRYSTASLWNLFFAPNPSTNYALWALAKEKKVLTVHTVCSAPAFVSKKHWIRSPLPRTDRIIVLSQHTEQMLLEHGADPARLIRIPPCIEMPVVEDTQMMSLRKRLHIQDTGPVMVFPGDLEFGSGALLSIQALADSPEPEAVLLMAARAKTQRAKAQQAWLCKVAQALGVSERVHWLGETQEFHAALALADVVVLASETLYAKMDYPMVVLEAMALGKPVIVAEKTPAQELSVSGGVAAVRPVRDSVSAQVADWFRRRDQALAAGRLGAAYVRKHHSSDPIAAAYEEVYDALLLAGR